MHLPAPVLPCRFPRTNLPSRLTTNTPIPMLGCMVDGLFVGCGSGWGVVGGGCKVQGEGNESGGSRRKKLKRQLSTLEGCQLVSIV